MNISNCKITVVEPILFDNTQVDNCSFEGTPTYSISFEQCVITNCFFGGDHQPTEEQLEEYPALKDAYDAYLMIRKLTIGR